jgi:hypothetical protein
MTIETYFAVVAPALVVAAAAMILATGWTLTRPWKQGANHAR